MIVSHELKKPCVYMRSSHVYTRLKDVYVTSDICEVLGKPHYVHMASEIIKLNTASYPHIKYIVYQIIC